LLLVVDTLTDDAALNRLHNVAHSVQTLFGDVRLQRTLLEARQQREQRFPEFSHAWEWLVVERSEGHMTKSLEYVRQLGRVERDDHYPLIQRQMPYLLNFDPDLTITVDQLEETLGYLEQLPPGVLHHDDEEERVAAEALWEPLRRYYLGLTHSRLGAAADAESDAAVLDGMVVELPEYEGILERWARTIRADVAYREGAWERVVELADREAAPVKPELDGFLWEAETIARVRYTDALLELGRYREALRWLDHGPYNFWDTGLWVAFRSERSAHAHEALGENDEAIADYQRFIDTWIDADAELQPRVQAARQRLSELVSARG